jgi:hypothetical protein
LSPLKGLRYRHLFTRCSKEARLQLKARYLNLHPPVALSPAQAWPIRRLVEVQEHEAKKDNEQQKEERSVYLLKQATVTR